MDKQISLQKPKAEIDFSVFNISFDPHRRAYQCERLIKLIQKNEPDELHLISRFHKKPQRAQILCSANQQALLEYVVDVYKLAKE